jgi:serine/threonine protein kinase
MAKATPDPLDRWPPAAGNDAPTQSRAAGDATLPLGPGTTPHALSSKPATHLGPYELIEKLGQGGMGTVWKARHTKLDKLVALKLLPPHLMTDADAVSRFEREMKAVGKLEHVHIVRAMDADEADGIHYLVMEYIEGIDLAKLVKQRGPRKLAEACQMIRHAALGLAHAHEQGLIHRDIKPSNLLLSKKGLVKILDLGLARLQSEKAADEASLTVHGEVMGTPDYMAPEQWQNTHNVGPAADLYALGCTLYFLVIGRAPFSTEDRTTTTQKMTAHLLSTPPGLRDSRPEVPDELDALYRKLMAKEPAARPASAKALADELREMIRSWTKSPASAEAIPWSPVANSTAKIKLAARLSTSSARWLVAACSAILVAIGALALWNMLASKSDTENSELSRGTTTTDHAAHVANSPVGPTPPLANAPFSADDARRFQQQWAQHLNLPIEYTNSLGMTFRLIPPGEYDRGTSSERIDPLLETLHKWQNKTNIAPSFRVSNERGIRSEAPEHRVRIKQPFYLAEFEVTQRQFNQIMDQNRSYFGPNGGGRGQVADNARPYLPVESITFGETGTFCHNLAQREGLAGSTSAYRLPTDAEWEYACRAGTTTPFWFGYNGQDQYMSQYLRCDNDKPQPVGRHKPNPFGLHDMHGNVWEICQDYFADDDFTHYASQTADSPVVLDKGIDHVARGGSFAMSSLFCRSASRTPFSRPSPYIGFRPVLSVEAVQSLIKAKP